MLDSGMQGQDYGTETRRQVRNHSSSSVPLSHSERMRHSQGQGQGSSRASSQTSNSVDTSYNSEEEVNCHQKHPVSSPRSPLVDWICKLGSTKPMTANNTNHSQHQQHPSKPLTSLDKSRKQAAMNFLNYANDDDEAIGRVQNEDNTLQLSDGYTNVIAPFTPPLIRISSNASTEQLSRLQPLQGESRIIAPGVGKISPGSAVEVRLKCEIEQVAVLCSVDVLKMHSTYFLDRLHEQEANNQPRPISPDMLWREPVLVEEELPNEGAALLETIHLGRGLNGGEWSLCWARLSVRWGIEDMIVSYASQICDHFNRIDSIITSNHWRTNPSVFSSFRVAVFRKGGTSPNPTIIQGTVLEAPVSVGYSKLRVVFDNNRPFTAVSSIGNVLPSPSAHLQFNQPGSNTSSTESPLSKPLNRGTPTAQALTPLQQAPPQIVGDVAPPFWVQSQKEGSPWVDPDEFFIQEAKKFISPTDKRLFTEMSRALIELPELLEAMQSLPSPIGPTINGIRSLEDLTSKLKRPEYRIIWSSETPEFLPKFMASELIRAAYIE